MNHAYKGPTPVKVKDKVDLIVLDKVYNTATVVEPMSTQFMCTTKENTLFFFYADQGLTWRKHK